MIEFICPPTLGTVIELDGQGYELVEVQPYDRIDGTASNLLVWKAPCFDCTSEFEVKSGLTFKAPNRRCPACKKTGKPVKGRRGRKVRVTVTHA